MNNAPADLPVILLYNLDRSWPPVDIKEILDLVETLAQDLVAVGHPTEIVCLDDDRLERAMQGCDPSRQIVFNWCEEVPGVPRSSSLVARKLEELGFTYTGADSKALLFSQDKPAVKERLLKKRVPTPRWQVYSGEEPWIGIFFPPLSNRLMSTTVWGSRRRRSFIPARNCRSGLRRCWIHSTSRLWLKISLTGVNSM